MARKRPEDMLKSSSPLNPEHHAILGETRKRLALLLAVARETDLTGIINQALDKEIDAYRLSNAYKWVELEHKFAPHAEKGVKKVKKV